jgi:hypothetical protein
MPRFVLLYHKLPSGSARASHCDLMLEAGEVLRTWSIAALPHSWGALADPSSASSSVSLASSNIVVAEELPHHRPVYLEYEGPIGDGRGHVSRLEAGTFKTIRQSPQEWVIAISGTQIRGQLSLQYDAETGSNWLLTFETAAN